MLWQETLSLLLQKNNFVHLDQIQQDLQVLHCWISLPSLWDWCCCPTGWLWSVHVSFGLNLGQIGGSEPKILGSCHPQTAVVRACEPISIWPQQRPPPSFWQTSKHWQWSGNSGYLRSLPTSRPHVHGMPSFLFLLLLYCHGLDRVPIWLGKSHFHQQVGWEPN